LPIFEIRFIFHHEHLILIGVFFNQQLKFINLPYGQLLDDLSAVGEGVAVAAEDRYIQLRVVELEGLLLLI
jgi:hypothetical protein